MTDKLPVVGKRYRATEANEFIPNKDYIMRCDKILSNEVILDENTRGGHFRIPIDDFFKYFEEIPEDNLQKAGYRDKAEIWKLLDYNKKYKEKDSNKIVKLNSIGTAEVMFRYEGKNYNEGEFNKCSPSSFLNFFQELPEDSLQEKEPADNEPKVNGTHNPVDLEKEKVNIKEAIILNALRQQVIANFKKTQNSYHNSYHDAIEKTLEELKYFQKHNDKISYRADDLSQKLAEMYLELFDKAGRLINALEAEKTVMSKQEPKWLPMSCAPKCGSPITVKQSTNERHKIFKANWFLNKWYSLYEEGGNEEVYPEFWLEGSKEEPKIDMNVVKEALKECTRNMKDFNAKMDEKYPMSKPDTKIDTKEECVEPVSIWKDVSELPEGLVEEGIVKWKKGGYSLMITAHGRFFDSAGNRVSSGESVAKFISLTDFINSFEQMQKDIEDLKRK